MLDKSGQSTFQDVYVNFLCLHKVFLTLKIDRHKNILKTKKLFKQTPHLVSDREREREKKLSPFQFCKDLKKCFTAHIYIPLYEDEIT